MVLIKSLIIMVFVLYISVVVCCYSKRNWVPSKNSLQNFSYISRAEWNATISKRILIDCHKPVSLITLKYTNTTHCYRKLACTRAVKKIQKQHMSEGSNDIQYNFLFDPFGNVYEGLGWFSLNMDGNGRHLRSLGFIGPENSLLTDKQKHAVANLLRDGLILNILKTNYRIIGTAHIMAPISKIKEELQLEMNKVDSEEFDSTEGLDDNPSVNTFDIDYEVTF